MEDKRAAHGEHEQRRHDVHDEQVLGHVRREQARLRERVERRNNGCQAEREGRGEGNCTTHRGIIRTPAAAQLDERTGIEHPGCRRRSRTSAGGCCHVIAAATT